MSMGILDIATILLVLAAFFSYVNHRKFHLPYTIALTLAGLITAAVALLADVWFPALGIGPAVRQGIGLIDFPESLMHGMLGFLLFAGAMHIDLDDLLSQRWTILSLATAGVLISTMVIGTGSYYVFQLMGTPVAFAYCLVFGALISPTDPIAVIGVMKTVGAPKSLEIKVAGESLFNDGVGVVVYAVLLGAAGGGGHGASEGFDLGVAAMLFTREAAGGIALGLILGYVVYRLMRTLDERNTEILLSFALVMSIMFVAFRVHTSAPLACVVAGLFIGNHGRRFAMSESTTDALDLVWSFLDHSLNGILFLLVGLEIVTTVSLRPAHLVVALLLIPLALFGRLVSVAIPIGLLRRQRAFSPGVIRILTWGGLKGGISIALALALPPFPGRAVVLTGASMVVAFSVVAQGLTVGRLVRSQIPSEATP